MQMPVGEVWVKILNKGLMTIPKAMREKVGIKEGDVAKARVEGNKIVIEPREEVDYRIFTDEEIKRWKKEDKLPPKLAKKVKKLLADIP